MSEEQTPIEGQETPTKPHICTELPPRVVEAAQALGKALAGADMTLNDDKADLVRQQILVGWANEPGAGRICVGMDLHSQPQ